MMTGHVNSLHLKDSVSKNPHLSHEFSMTASLKDGEGGRRGECCPEIETHIIKHTTVSKYTTWCSTKWPEIQKHQATSLKIRFKLGTHSLWSTLETVG